MSYSIYKGFLSISSFNLLSSCISFWLSSTILFKTLVDSGFKDSSRSIRSYKTNALPFFKAFITAVEKTNQGYHWDWDEKKLIGKNVIAIFGEEEYLDNEGNVKIATRVTEFRSIEAYNEGKLKAPELKKLPEEEKKPEPIVEFAYTESDSLPF